MVFNSYNYILGLYDFVQIQQNLIRKIMRSTSQQLNFVKCLTGHGQDHNSIQTLKAYDMQGALRINLNIFNVTNCIFTQVVSSSVYSSVQLSPLLLREHPRTPQRLHVASMYSTLLSLEPSPLWCVQVTPSCS